MAMRERVAEWRALADAAQLEYPGWWHRIEDQLRRGKGKLVAPHARLSVAAHIVASREAVPAMADMLERAAVIIASDESNGAHSPDAAAWLLEWRGENG